MDFDITDFWQKRLPYFPGQKPGFILELLIMPNGPCSVPWDLELPIEFEEKDEEEEEDEE